MKLRNSAVFVFMILIANACVESENLCCGSEEEQYQFSGSWLLYERGYSPGTGYITEPVAAELQQTITFEADRKMTSTVPGLMEFRFYEVKPDSLTNAMVLTMFKTYPPAETEQPHSFTLSINKGNFPMPMESLRLDFRYCFEGCHMAFKRMDSSERK